MEQRTLYSELKQRIRAVFGTQAKFATAMGLNPATVSAKLNGRSDFSREEIEKTCGLLHVSLEEAHLYFFS